MLKICELPSFSHITTCPVFFIRSTLLLVSTIAWFAMMCGLLVVLQISSLPYYMLPYRVLKVLFLISCLIYQSYTDRTVDSHFSASDLERFQNAFTEAIFLDDLQSLYYAAINLKQFPPRAKEHVCNNLLSFYESSKLNEFEKKFYAVGIHKAAACTTKLPDNFRTSITAALSKDSSTAHEIYFNLFSAKTLGIAVDKSTADKLAKNLQTILKKDDSLNSLGYAFHIAAELGSSASFVVDRVEDAIVQADEVDGRMLQFEGGLSITALVINGAFKLTEAHNKPSPITAEQATKFASYFLSRRSVITSKGAHVLIEAIKSIAADQKVAPVCIQNFGNGQLQAESPTVNIKVVNLMGQPLVPAPASISGKIVHKADKAVLAEKVAFIARSSDKTVFSADLTTYKPARGTYSAEVSANGYSQALNFKVLGRVKVQSLEIAVGDSDMAAAAKKHTVNYPVKLSEVLSADSSQSIFIKVSLSDETTNKVIQVQQAFIRLALKETGEEIIFIADQDASRAYKFFIDIGTRGSDFRYKTGDYSLELIVGDSSLSNSFSWNIADIHLTFKKEKELKPSTSHNQMLPEIKHIFRQPEIRPSVFVSNAFTILSLIPLLLLFILWGKIGINVSNFSFRPSVLLFHIGFAAILGTFGLFWLKLDMFETLRYLIPTSIITFLAGNRMLSRINAEKAKVQ